MMFRLFGKKSPMGSEAFEKKESKQEKLGESIKTNLELQRVNRDTKIAALLKHEFKDIKRKEDQGKLRLLFVGSGERHGLNVASLAQGWDVPKEFAAFVAETGAEANFLKAHGLDAEKAHTEYGIAGKESDVVFVLDDEIRPTAKFLNTVKGEGYLICRTDMAMGAMQSGNFEFKGILTVSNGEWKHDESMKYETVQTNEQFKQFKKAEFEGSAGLYGEGAIKGVVTYEEAVNKLKELGRPTNDVLAEYKKLIEEIREKNGEAMARGETVFKIPNAKGEMVEVNTALPPAEPNNICILKKKKNALVG